MKKSKTKIPNGVNNVRNVITGKVQQVNDDVLDIPLFLRRKEDLTDDEKNALIARENEKKLEQIFNAACAYFGNNGGCPEQGSRGEFCIIDNFGVSPNIYIGVGYLWRADVDDYDVLREILKHCGAQSVEINLTLDDEVNGISKGFCQQRTRQITIFFTL